MKLLNERELVHKHRKYNDLLFNHLDNCTISLNDFFCSNFRNSDMAIASYSILGYFNLIILLQHQQQQQLLLLLLPLLLLQHQQQQQQQQQLLLLLLLPPLLKIHTS